MPSNRYVKHFEKRLKKGPPFIALRNAINSYMDSRSVWLQSSCGISSGYGWRGGFREGKLFFNKNTTRSNLQKMEQILIVLNDASMSNEAKCIEIKRIGKTLSKNGRGRELINIFLEMAGVSGTSLFTGAISKKNKKIFANGQVYKIGRLSGIDNRTYLGELKSEGSSSESSDLNIKAFKPRQGDRMTQERRFNDRKRVLETFEDVYNFLGPRYLPDFESLPKTFDYHIGHVLAGDVHEFQIFPKIQGIPLKEYTAQKGREGGSNDFELYASCANFLYDLHCLEIVHRDLRADNIIVVNELGGVFFIGYSSALHRDELNKKDWQIGVVKDIAIMVASVHTARCESSLPVKPINLLQLAKVMKFERWFSNIHIVEDDIKYSIGGCIKNFVDYCTQEVAISGFDYENLFLRGSMEAAIQFYEQEFS
ncbi:hypothetical protein AAEX28_05840 [Lentisphaerota bacterium WC36G]|nr:hypothetical protein LJT99_08700 [Lentisphaerae bacterium WC36]